MLIAQINLYKALHEAVHKALYEALHEALRTEALHEALREALRTEALHETLHRVPAIFPIASTGAYVATLIFTLSSLHPSYLGRHQNGSQQRTVARTRRLLLELDDRRQNQTTV